MALIHGVILETRAIGSESQFLNWTERMRIWLSSMRAEQQLPKSVRCRRPEVNNRANLWIIAPTAPANHEMQSVGSVVFGGHKKV